MKARWFVIGSIICVAAGWILPYVLIQMDADAADDWGDIIWIIVAPGVYAWYTYILWAIAAILLIVAVIVYVKGKKKRRRR